MTRTENPTPAAALLTVARATVEAWEALDMHRRAATSAILMVRLPLDNPEEAVRILDGELAEIVQEIHYVTSRGGWISDLARGRAETAEVAAHAAALRLGEVILAP